jgi:adenylate cyclase
MPANVEIERKYLVAERPQCAGRGRATEILQGYLALDAGVEVRLRRVGLSCFVTIKGSGGRARIEVELPIELAEFEALWSYASRRSIRKTRSAIPYGAHTIELDIYGGGLKGLVVAEVEFASEAKAAAFDPPPWFGREVTTDRRYRNSVLAVQGLPG